MTSDTRPTTGGFESHPPRDSKDAKDRTPAEIEADIEVTRERLAGTVNAIAERVKPANVARRGADSAKAAAQNGAESAKAAALTGAEAAKAAALTGAEAAKAAALTGAKTARAEFTDDHGDLRIDRVGALAAVVVVLMGLLVWRRRR